MKAKPESKKPSKATQEAEQIEAVSLSRRGLVKHKTNPFLHDASINSKTRIRKVAEANGERLMVVSEDTGEIVAPAGFWHAEEVDQTKFIKLYINGVKAFKELTAAGTKIFELLYIEIQKNIGRDKVHLSFQTIDQDATPISRATFYRGMAELVEKGFIADTTIQGFYFINPDYMWNGNRLAFVREYRLKQTTKRGDPHTLDLFEEAPALPALPPPKTHGKKKAEKSNPPTAKKTARAKAPAAKKTAAKTPPARSKK